MALLALSALFGALSSALTATNHLLSGNKARGFTSAALGLAAFGFAVYALRAWRAARRQ